MDEINELFCLLFQKLEAITGKDLGDFGGWDGYEEYCLREWKDNEDVMTLIECVRKTSEIGSFIKERQNECNA